MSLRKILISGLVGLSLISTAAQARFIFVLPPAGAANPTVLALNEQLLQVGSVSVPDGVSQVLINAAGDKAIIIARNSTAPVSFVSIQGGQIGGTRHSLVLGNQAATVAALTPDGTRVLVLAGSSDTGKLYVVDVDTESVQASYAIAQTPSDLVITPDSRYAAILSSPSLLTSIDLTNGTILSSSAIPEIFGSARISLSPSGDIFVTGLYRMIRYAGQPPFTESARTSLFAHPGKLLFSPDGRYAIATNELIVTNGASVLSFDLESRGSRSPAGAQIAAIPLVVPGSQSPLKVDKLIPISGTAAIAFVSSQGRLFKVNYPALSAENLVVGGVVAQSVLGVTTTNEFPNVRSLYVKTSGELQSYDLLSNNVRIAGTAATGADVTFTPQPSATIATQVFAYNANQTVAPNVRLRPYFIRAVDANGRPVYGAHVTFTPETAGAILSDAAAVTNVDGYAWVTVTSPATNGEFKVRANVDAGSVILSSIVQGGSGGGDGGDGTGGVSRIVKVSGDGQLMQLAWANNAPLVVRVEDANGAPLAGQAITWTETGGIVFFGTTNVVTDAKGQAEIAFVPSGSFVPGTGYRTYTVTATSAVGNVSFTVTAYPLGREGIDPAPTVRVLTGSSLTVKLGTKVDNAFQIEALTTLPGGSAIPGVGLAVSTENTDPTLGPVALCEGGTVLTGQNGVASCNLVVTGKTGEVPLTVSAGGRFSRFEGFTLTVTPGDPVAPVILSGNNQSGKPGATLAAPLVARIADSFGNLLPGTQVTWEVVTKDSVRLFNTISTADFNGRVSTSVQLGSNSGKFQVKVTAGGKSATFDLTIDTLATGFAIVSGNGQPVTAINQPFSQPLVVVVTDAQGAPVSNAIVSWAVTSGSAILSATSATTGTNGRAQVNVTAGSVPGSIVVSATFPNLPALVFNLQSRLPGPSITAASFTNYASGLPGLAPGNLVLITGSGLAPNLRGQLNADLLKGHLPYEMAGVTVELQQSGRSVFAPIYRVANEAGIESVLIQVPFELTVGTADAVVNVSGGNTTATGIPVQSVSPGIIEDVIAERRAAVVIRSDGLTVTPQTPARRGEDVRMYAIGVGQTTPLAETNRVGQPEQNVRAALAVGVDDKGVTVLRAQLAENLIGVYEIIFRIPEDATIGSDRPLGLVIEEVAGQPVWANGSVISIGQ